MSRASKKKIQKVVVTKKVPADESYRLISEKVDRFTAFVQNKVEEVVKKHNELSTQITDLQKVQQQIATFAATEFGKMLGQNQMLSQELGRSIDHLDINLLALAEVSKEVFGQLTQIDHILQNGKVDVVPEGGYKLNVEVSEADTDTIKTNAEAWFTDVVGSAFKTVRERRSAEELSRQKAAELAELEARKAVADKDEAERIEDEMRAAESAGIVQQIAGGMGTDIPEGADVFGG